MAQLKDSKTGKWMFYGSYVDSTGKRKQYKKRGFISKKLARIAEDNFRDHIEDPIAHITISELFDNYLLFSKKSVKESTHLSNSEMKNKICSELGSHLLCDLNEDILQDYINKLEKKHSKEYVKKIYYNINKVLRFAYEKKYISYNPLSNVRMDLRKSEIKKELAFWEPADFQKFIINVDEQLYKVLFSFMYYMGTRKGETIALTWSKIDLIKKTVKIDCTASSKLNNKITPPKTNNSLRTISIPNDLLKLMIIWYEYQKTLYEFNQDCFVFGYHKPISVETIRRKFKKYICDSNSKLDDSEKIPEIRIHDLRHSHASYLINNMSHGFTDFDIAKRLGDTVSTLHNTYAHWFKAADSNIMDFMNNGE